MTYHLTAVGLGPGEPDLITLKGQRAIEQASLIFVPRSQDGEQSLALRIAEPWLNRDRQQVIELLLPMTRHSDRLTAAWQAAARQIADSLAALSGEAPARGAYLLLGDPLLYGTFTYISAALSELQPEIRIEIVPGVTSFAAAAAQAQFVLGTTADRIAVLPASYETDAAALRRLLLDFDTIILMKVGPVLPQIVVALEELGLLDSAVYAERVGMPEGRLVQGRSILSIRTERRPYLSLLIVNKLRKVHV